MRAFTHSLSLATWSFWARMMPAVSQLRIASLRKTEPSNGLAAQYPGGATGGAAAEIWKRLDAKGAMPTGIDRKGFDSLNAPGTTPEALAKVVAKIIAAVDKCGSKPKKAGRR